MHPQGRRWANGADRATNVAALQHFHPSTQEARALQQTPPDVLAWLASQVGLEAHLAKQKSAPALHPCRPRATPSVLQPSCIQAAPDLDGSPPAGGSARLTRRPSQWRCPVAPVGVRR